MTMLEFMGLHEEKKKKESCRKKQSKFVYVGPCHSKDTVSSCHSNFSSAPLKFYYNTKYVPQ